MAFCEDARRRACCQSGPRRTPSRRRTSSSAMWQQECHPFGRRVGRATASFICFDATLAFYLYPFKATLVSGYDLPECNLVREPRPWQLPGWKSPWMLKQPVRISRFGALVPRIRPDLHRNCMELRMGRHPTGYSVRSELSVSMDRSFRN